MATTATPPKPAEWETLIDDYNHGGGATKDSTLIFELALSSILRKDSPLPLKLNLLTFLEQHCLSLFPSSLSDSTPVLSRLFDSLRSVIQSPNDPFSLKDQFLTSTTSILIALLNYEDVSGNSQLISGLVELLLTIINRPNHGFDRQTRGVACECLRQLELAFPSLLSEIAPHIWALCQTERTHVAQSYVLLLSTVIYHIVTLKPFGNTSTAICNAAIPLIPFNVPRYLMDDHGCGNDRDFVWKDKEVSYKELKRVIAFLLECPQNLTTFGLIEFMATTIPVAEELELQSSLLKVQLSGLLYAYEPLLCHAFLAMYMKFLDSSDGQEVEVARRLLFLTKESQHHLAFRLLGLHWLLGFILLVVQKGVVKQRSIVDMSLSFYPNIFDALALKVLKLDLLALCSVLLRNMGNADDLELSDVKLFEDGLVSVSAFKWLPPWSTETSVAFHTFHKFLISTSSHLVTDSPPISTLTESNIFQTFQRILVDSTLEFQGLVPVVVAFVDRLLRCHKHSWLGEHLLKTLNENLLPKVKIDYRVGSYLPLFERIAETKKVSPSVLIVLLTKFISALVEKHGPDTVLKSWSQGSKVLGICRTMLLHHHSSRLFLGLSHLLAFTCLYFPDLEVCDNARSYLRMLICIPGKKLRDILSMGEQLPGVSPPSHSVHKLKKSRSIATYIHLERLVPLLVNQSWSLSLPALGNDGNMLDIGGITNNENTSNERDFSTTSGSDIMPETERILPQQEPLRVMDSKISEIVTVLRKHFSLIPDLRHDPGIRIKIPCSLRFDSEPLCRIWAVNMPANGVDEMNVLPAIYATVLRFNSSAPYGSIPSYQIPFLLGQPPKDGNFTGQTNSLDIVPRGVGHEEDKSFKAPVVIELEPRDPMPGLVDVFIETNLDNGQIIQGQLHSITVGIEDMFLRAILPENIPQESIRGYYADLFNALWEACGTSLSTGREIFVLKGGKGFAAINGTRSVKLLEVPVISLIQAVEQYLAPFVVCVMGDPLIDMVKSGEVIKDVLWKDSSSDSSLDVGNLITSSDGGPLYLKYFNDEDERGSPLPISRKNLGFFHILIFLPPRFHLLLEMDVHEASTLVRIRTDHWPCLAYIDDYLEALFLN